ncbi:MULTISPECIES: sigma-54 interaction domain-containing protein [unclassified Hahella]|uniref:sigma-54 interaction domain-containing protein n=1 Tax=unclassified Hahella TaxID=2624107 RepID=UPI000FDEC959|nr:MULTISPECIES: sigma 54-interacting transcriptional regulator [unclassified Hahella]AZZ93169.1 AAA family ATPase [Hahella sp. KA22]QAY56542.1 AAA family ATPase [Hahella sp. KA22]
MATSISDSRLPIEAQLAFIQDNPLMDLLDSFCEGSIIVDQKARIRWLSDKYRLLLELPEDAAKYVGRPVEEAIPNSMMRQVVESGRPILLDLMRIRGTWMVVTRMPIRDDQDQVIGGIGFVFYKQLDYMKPLVEKFGRLRGVPTTAEKQLADMRQAKYSFADFIGQSPVIRELIRRARQAAELDTTVLLLGETGTGKEVLAHAIHHASVRAERPFVGVNMAAIPESLLEAEFFGAAPGAYTGADRKGRIGKIQLADGGTLFLDEVGDLSLSLQTKLLRVLQEQEFEALGSNRIIRVNVRIIAATSRNLKQMVETGEFRSDLYYRLNVLPIEVPPLRDREGDIELLVGNMLRQFCDASALPLRKPNAEAMRLLHTYHWPGNVRELHNTLERAFIFAEGTELTVADFAHLQGAGDKEKRREAVKPLSEAMAEAERNFLKQAMSACNGNRSASAKALGISRATFYEKLQKHELI